MERDYVISNRSKVTYYIIAVVFFGMALLMFFVARKDSDHSPLYIMSLLFVILPALLLINALRKKVTLNDYSIKFAGPFSTKELPIRDIKGYRIVVNKSAQSVVFETNNGNGKLTLSSVTDLADNEELLSWVQSNFTDLNAVDMQKEKDALLENSALGTTSEERESALKRAKNKTIAFAILAGVIGAMSLFYDGKIWVGLSVILPFIGIVIMVTSKGLIKFMTNSKRTVYPNITIGMMIPAMVSIAKALNNTELYDSGNLWLPALSLTAVIVLAIIFTGLSKSIPLAVQIIFMVIFMGFQGFGNVLHVNSVFDDSEPVIYKAVVTDKTISHGKHTSYYLQTTAWGPEGKSLKPDVGRRMFDNINIGDTINMYYQRGALNIPWYKIGRK